MKYKSHIQQFYNHKRRKVCKIEYPHYLKIVTILYMRKGRIKVNTNYLLLHIWVTFMILYLPLNSNMLQFVILPMFYANECEVWNGKDFILNIRQLGMQTIWISIETCIVVDPCVYGRFAMRVPVTPGTPMKRTGYYGIRMILVRKEMAKRIRQESDHDENKGHKIIGSLPIFERWRVQRRDKIPKVLKYYTFSLKIELNSTSSYELWIQKRDIILDYACRKMTVSNTYLLVTINDWLALVIFVS